MGKYLKLFENHAQYETFIGGGGENTPFVKPNVSHCIGENHVHYNPRTWADEYLTFVALENTTFTFTPASGNAISYSIDNGDSWTVGNSVEITKDSKVLWRGEMTSTSSNGVGTFSSTGQFNVQGNVMSLLFGDNFKGKTDLTGKDSAFCTLFNSNSKLVNAQNLSLPAKTLAVDCYNNMFSGCTSLTKAPVLPAMTLVNYCYTHMFHGCTSLTKAPELPATTLANYCYNGMFNGCTSLVNAPTLPATTLARNCYYSMFDGCTSLTKAPELPATTLKVSCYRAMFNGCTSLNYIKAMFTTTPGTNYTDSWVSGVASSGTFVKNSAASWDVTGNDGIPSGWTIETATK